MGLIDELSLGTKIDLGGFRSGFSDASRMVDNFASSMSSRLEGMKIEAPKLAMAGGGGDSGIASIATNMADALQPVAIQLQSALAPLNSIGARMSAQLDQVGGTFMVLARRIDQQIKLPKFEAGIERTRMFVRDKFGEMEGSVGKFARGADTALGAVQVGAKLNAWVKGFGDVGNKGLREFSKIKAPTLNFSSTIKSITNVNNIAAQATRTIGGMGSQLALAVGAFGATYKTVEFLKTGIGDAIDLNETLSKTGTIFGASANLIVAQADRMSAAFGTSKDEYLNAATNFGAVFKGLGKSQIEAAGMGNSLAKLAMDMASFDNTSNGEAFAAIGSALRGEMDPIEKFRVFLNADKVAAEALSLGLAKTKGEITETSKKMAIMSLITKQTTDAQGDLARTAGGMANQQRRLSGTISNLGTTIGMTLMPAVEMGTSLLNGFVSSASSSFLQARPVIDSFVSSFAHGMNTAWAAGQQLVPAITALGSTIVGAFGSAGSSVFSFAPTFATVVDGVKSGLLSMNYFLGDTIAALKSTFGGETSAMAARFVTQVGGWIKTGFETMAFQARNFGDIVQIAGLQVWALGHDAFAWVKTIPENFGRVATWFANDWLRIMASPFSTLGGVIEAFGTSLGDFMRNPTAGFKFDGSKILDDFKAITAKFPEMAKAEMADVGPEMARIFDRIDKREAEYTLARGPSFMAPAPAMAQAPALAAPRPQLAMAGDTEVGKGKDKGKGKTGPLFAGAAELGSKESYERIISAQFGGVGRDPMAKVTQINNQQLQVLKRIDQKLGRPAAPAEKLFTIKF